MKQVRNDVVIAIRHNTFEKLTTTTFPAECLHMYCALFYDEDATSKWYTHSDLESLSNALGFSVEKTEYILNELQKIEVIDINFYNPHDFTYTTKI